MLIVVVFAAYRSGRKRNRFDMIFFFCIIIAGGTVLLGAAAFLDEWLEWKDLDGYLFTDIERIDSRYMNKERVPGGTIYEWRVPGRTSGRMLRRDFEPRVALADSVVESVLYGLAISLIGLVVRGLSVRRMGSRLKKDHCYSCGYNLTGNSSGRCPECGVSSTNGAVTARGTIASVLRTLSSIGFILAACLWLSSISWGLWISGQRRFVLINAGAIGFGWTAESMTPSDELSRFKRWEILSKSKRGRLMRASAVQMWRNNVSVESATEGLKWVEFTSPADAQSVIDTSNGPLAYTSVLIPLWLPAALFAVACALTGLLARRKHDRTGIHAQAH